MSILEQKRWYVKVDSEIQKGIDRIFETGIIKSSLPKKKMAADKMDYQRDVVRNMVKSAPVR